MYKLTRFLAATYATAAFLMSLPILLIGAVIALWYCVYTGKPIGNVSTLEEIQTFFKDDGMVWLITIGLVLTVVVGLTLRFLNSLGD